MRINEEIGSGEMRASKGNEKRRSRESKERGCRG